MDWMLQAVPVHVTVLLLALLWDLMWSEPPNRVHPVVWMGLGIGWLHRQSARLSSWGSVRVRACIQMALGAAIVMLVTSSVYMLSRWVWQTAAVWPWLQVLIGAYLLKASFAIRALREAAVAMRRALCDADLAVARRGLASLCSRDATTSSRGQLTTATVESVAENTSDSIVAPLLFYALFGVPGALVYRAINTMDAMLGYHGELEYLGKAAARVDDVVNWLPARLTAGCFLLAGLPLNSRVRHGLWVWRRDARATESPNAGHPMAMMAGLLGVVLDKSGAYRLGTPERGIELALIDEAWRHVAITSGLCALLVGAVLVANGGPLLEFVL